MIYDEATINFIEEKVEKMIGESGSDDECWGYQRVLEMLENMKKIKAIN